jgi:putative oxidoreductase
MAYLVAGWEVGGGVAVALGILPRIAALGLLGVMLVAMLKVHLAYGFFMPPVGKGLGYEYAMTLAAMALAILVAGPGKAAILPELKLKGKKKPG